MSTPPGSPRPFRTPGSFPAEATPFIGRRADVERGKDLLLRDEVRLLTLTGTGGTGKTRLALRIAADLVEAFGHGVVWVPLAPIRDASVVASSVAVALGVRESGGGSPVAALQSYLHDKHLLLLLDNFEHVLDAAILLPELLATAPRLKILVTSRAALRLSAEHELAVGPMSVPSRNAELEELSQLDVVQLFVQRATAAAPDFRLRNDNAAAVAEICRRLDGLPLPIELAAGRVKVLSPKMMLDRLDRRLKLLTGGARDLPERHQTLRNMIAWSYDLLDEPERRLFCRLAVFAGGATLEAIETVCDPSGDLGIDVLDGLATLLDQSLVRQEEQGGGARRFSMLETIREFALERLGLEGEAYQVRGRHAGYYLTLARDADPRLRSAERETWLGRLEREHDNLRTALAWSLELEVEDDTALELAASLWWFWYFGGHLSEGRRWLERILERFIGRKRTAACASALHGAGLLAYYQGEHDLARARLEESVAIWREIGDERGLAYALIYLGRAAADLGDLDEARAIAAESVARFEKVDDRWGSAQALLYFGVLEVFDRPGPPDRAGREALQRSERLFRDLGDRWGIAGALNNLGIAAQKDGDGLLAQRLIQESIVLLRDSRTPDKWRIAILLNRLARLVRLDGDRRRAAALYRESLELNRELGTREGVAKCLEGIALLALQDGDAEEAARLLGAGESLRGRVPLPGNIRADYESDVAAVRARLDQGAFTSAWAEGRGMAGDEATGRAEAIAARMSLAEPRASAPGAFGEAHGAGEPGETTVFAKEGEYWTVTYGGRTLRFRDTKGLRYLDHLLRHRGREFHALELAPVANVGASDDTALRHALAGEGLAVSGLGDAGEVLDPRARAEYRQRLDDLERELDEAMAHNDLGWAERLRSEIDVIEAELASAVGLGGRSRRAGSSTEKARVNVTKTIQAAIARIGRSAPALGRHLEASIRTGTFFGYLPGRRGTRT